MVSIVNNRVVIDPLHLTEQTSQLLSKYLLELKKDGMLLERDKIFHVDSKHITLTYSILIRKTVNDNWHYDVLANHCSGSGSDWVNYDVIAVLKHANLPAAPLPLKIDRKLKRTYLIQHHDTWNQYKLMQRCSHLGVRGLFSGIPSLISIRKPPGKLLSETLAAQRKSRSYSLEQSCRIALQLLQALKNQIHDHMVCHKNINPDHIFYDMESGQVYYLGLGFARLINDKSDKRSRGNPVFSAPEEFISTRTGKPVTALEYAAFVSMKSSATMKSDVYSIARVIGLLFGDADTLLNSRMHVDACIYQRANAGWRTNLKLFTGCSQIALEDKQRIKHQLELMTSIEPAERPDLYQCIAFFQQIYIDLKLTNIPQALHSSVTSAGRLAAVAQQDLFLIKKNSELCQQIRAAVVKLKFNFNLSAMEFIDVLSRKFNKRLNLLAIELRELLNNLNVSGELTLTDFLDAAASTCSFEQLHFTMIHYIGALPDNIHAISAFLELMGISCLSHATSKEELAASISRLFADFYSELDRVKRLYHEAVADQRSQVAAELDHLLQSIQSADVTVDNIKAHIDHMDRKLQSLFAPLDIAAVAW